jgi:putative (di)nucleoside polyphosphate hydrolase
MIRPVDNTGCQGGSNSIMKSTSCGVLVTDGTQLLLGHATRSPRWDIPKGLADPGEVFVAAAVRELREETGLEVGSADLLPLGVHRYRPGKDLALFEWRPAAMPDPATLRCTSMFAVGNTLLPEFDRFGIFDWPDAVSRVGRDMGRILKSIRDGGILPR